VSIKLLYFPGLLVIKLGTPNVVKPHSVTFKLSQELYFDQSNVCALFARRCRWPYEIFQDGGKPRSWIWTINRRWGFLPAWACFCH